MKKIIIILVYSYFINSYLSNNDFLENDTNISVYTLNGNCNINGKNTLFKRIFLTESKKNFSNNKDFNALTSLLLTNIINHNEQSKKNYYDLTSITDGNAIFHIGDSGFLTDNIFLNLYEAKLPKKLKIFCTGSYHYPEFTNDVSNILIKKEFIENNRDDIINHDNTIYYKSNLLPKIMSQLQIEKKTEYQKNIPVQYVAAIGIKILNWITHCYEEKTFESIVFLPKEMIDIGESIFKCLEKNNIITKGKFIYIADTQETIIYCDMIKNNNINDLKILINKDTILDRENIAIQIYLAVINYYCYKINIESLDMEEEPEYLINIDLSEIERTILYSNAFNEDDEIKKIIPTLEENTFPYLYLYYKLIYNHKEPPKKIIIFLYNTVIKLLLSNKNQSFKKIHSEIEFLLCVFEKIILVFQNTIEAIGIKILYDLLQLYQKEIITEKELIEKITQEDFKKAITEEMFIKGILAEVFEEHITEKKSIEEIINNKDNFIIPNIFTPYNNDINNLKYSYYNKINNKDNQIKICNKDLNNFFLDFVLLFNANTESTNLLNSIYSKLIFFEQHMKPDLIKNNISKIQNTLYTKILESKIIKDSTEKAYIYTLAIELFLKKQISRMTFYSAIINCNKEEKFNLEIVKKLSQFILSRPQYQL